MRTMRSPCFCYLCVCMCVCCVVRVRVCVQTFEPTGLIFRNLVRMLCSWKQPDSFLNGMQSVITTLQTH